MTAIRRHAAKLYAAEEFASAAALLRAAAKRASAPDAIKLARTAKQYTAVGAHFATGDANAVANPRSALKAFSRAYDIDRRGGKRAHRAVLRRRLAHVAPRAAAGFMAKRRYHSAKRACDAAVHYGAGAHPMVGRVRSALEKKAREFFERAIELRDRRPNRSKAMLKRVVAITPDTSPWHRRAQFALR